MACGFVAISFIAAFATTGRTAVRFFTEPGYLEKSYELRSAAKRIDAIRRPGDTFWATEKHLVLWYLDAQQASKAITHPSNIMETSIIDTLASAGYVAKDELQM